MNKTLRQEIDALRDKGLERRLRIISSAPDRLLEIDNRTFLNFSSNNYLSLACHPEVKAAAAAAVERYGAGGTSSRLISGTLDIHAALESKIASFKHTEAALVFPSGFQTNTGIIASLLAAGDCVIMDRLNHASLWDGAKLSGARVFIYPHRDMNGLEKTLKRARAGYRRKLIVTDSLFSMDGDRAPLKDIVALARKHDAWTMIDEAHATGIFGAQGSGLAEECGVAGSVDIIMGTLSKALGSQGGFVCGSHDFIEYLINRGRPFIYTTSLAPANCAAALAAIGIVEREPGRRTALLEKARGLRAKLRAIGFSTGDSESQIVPFMVGPVTEAVSLSAQLWRDGIFAPAIRPPTVPEGECRLRFSLMSGHTEEDISRLVESIIKESE